MLCPGQIADETELEDDDDRDDELLDDDDFDELEEDELAGAQMQQLPPQMPS